MEIGVLIGKTLSKIKNQNNTEMLFTTTEGEVYGLYHNQDCCETVTIAEVIGNLEDLVGSPILTAEEVKNAETPNTHKGEYMGESFTWTFYKLSTRKGYVTIRWLGESKGYYSEEVSFAKFIVH